MKIISNELSEPTNYGLRRVFFAMKFFLFIQFVLVMSMSASNTYSQSVISIEKTNTSLKEVLPSGIKVVYLIQIRKYL